MKSKFIIQLYRSLALLCGIWAFSLLLPSCQDDETSGGPITISKVYLEDVNSSVPDREVSFARLGQLIRIEGSGFTGLKRVYINGVSAYFNPVMVSNGSMLVAIPRDTPTVDAEPDQRNTIRLENESYDATLDFEIRAEAPVIRAISNTLPLPGEMILGVGSGLVEVNKVVFPGGVEVTDGIYSDPDGEYFMVTVPEGVSEDGGSIMIECSNGGAYSPAFFNFKKGVILDFDGAGTHGYWGSAVSMLKPEDLESSAVGVGNVSHGTYVSHLPARISSYAAAKNRCSEVWTAGNDVDDWRGQLTPYIPAGTPVSNVGFQFDIYIPEAWSGSGFLKICLVNGFNGGEWAGNCYNFVPWVLDGEIVPIQNDGWRTVTIGLDYFYAFSDGDFTFEDVLAMREAASYKNFGIYFENSDFTLKNITGNDADAEIEFPSAETSVKIYTDNWRIVSLVTPVYSDFPETE